MFFSFAPKRFKKPNFFNKIIYTFFRSTKAQRSFNYAKKLIELGLYKWPVSDSSPFFQKVEADDEGKFQFRYS